MKQRTEEHILTQAPIEVQLGDKKHPLKPLKLKKQWEWRQNFLGVLGEIFKKDETADASSILKTGIGQLLTKYPQAILGLIVAFDSELTMERLEEATEEQVLLCFNEIYSLTILPIVAQAAAMRNAVTALSQQ